MDNEKNFSDDELNEELNKHSKEAEDLINDPAKMERFLQRLEKKLRNVPIVGERLSDIPIMISLVKSYMKKEYRDIPVRTIIGVVGALIYFLSPIDLLLDAIPILGYLDDIAVINFTLKMIHVDMEEYRQWREENDKNQSD
ncbi:MAG: hypothetical protein K0S47_4469 [Herbinix sp.]|jgi:uncharacterized membrane protein YkvA (DUF1232 family)|nr:hypothetical protein [Herbinix sp.]